MHPIQLAPCNAPGCWVIRIIASCGEVLVHENRSIAAVGEAIHADDILADEHAQIVIEHINRHCPGATLLINHGTTGSLVKAAHIGTIAQ